MKGLVVYCVILMSSVSMGEARRECPLIAGTSRYHPLNVKGAGKPRSEFVCPSVLSNWEHMREKLVGMLKGEKRFIRFRTPVRRYSNPYLGLENWDGYLTWVWVAEKFHYMLYYPHNFETLSLATTDIVCANLEERHILLNCSHCSSNVSCGVGKYELEELMENVTASVDMDWDYLCLEADYGVGDIVSGYPNKQSLAMLNSHNFAVPDIFYQWRFVVRLLTHCPTLSTSCTELKPHNYYCFDKHGSCIVKEVMSKYFIILILAAVMWLFSPLLVYYLPSSRAGGQGQSDMFPTHKQPVHFSRWLQSVLGYHITIKQSHSKTLLCIRRVLVLLPLTTLSFRFFLSHNYQLLSFFMLVASLVAIVHPHHLSIYVDPKVPKCFPLFKAPYPPGVIRWNSRKRDSREYQKLAYVMQERMFLFTDSSFWVYLFQNCFASIHPIGPQRPITLWVFPFLKQAKAVFVGVVKFVCALLIIIFYLMVPMLYFFKELLCAIKRGEQKFCMHVWSSNDELLFKWYKISASLLHGLLLSFLVVYLLITFFSVWYMLTEVIVFTYIGANITPNIGLQYVALVAALASAFHGMASALHKEYTSLLEDLVATLNQEIGQKYITNKLNQCANMKLQLVKRNDDIHLVALSSKTLHKKFYCEDGFVSYINTKLYSYVVETLQPVARHVLFFLVKVLGMIFFIGVAMWVKNVYKQENEVSDIFSLAGDVGIYFVPTALQFLSFRRKMGSKAEVYQKLEVADTVVDFIKEQSALL